MGLTARDQGSDAAAISLFRRAIDLKPHLWQAHSSLGAALADEKRFNEALTELTSAKQLAPMSLPSAKTLLVFTTKKALTTAPSLNMRNCSDVPGLAARSRFSGSFLHGEKRVCLGHC